MYILLFTNLMFCIFFFWPLIENYEKMRHPIPNMATILPANSTAEKKGWKPSFVVGKSVEDQVERVSREAAT